MRHIGFAVVQCAMAIAYWAYPDIAIYPVFFLAGVGLRSFADLRRPRKEPS